MNTFEQMYQITKVQLANALHERDGYRRMAEYAAIMALCGYFSRMRGPDAIAGTSEFGLTGLLINPIAFGTKLYAGSAPVPAAQAIDTSTALSVLSKAMQDDADFAWTWHCNIAMTAQDAGAPHDRANVWAANFMRRAFDVDTLTRVNAMLATKAKEGAK